MAKLQSLKARNDEGTRQIKCLIVDDRTSGTFIKHYDHKIFKQVLDNVDKDDIVKVYVPTPQEKGEIFEILAKDVDGDTVNFSISDEDVVFKMIKVFTDIEINEQDEEMLKEIIENPSELFLIVKSEMEKILFSIVEAFMNTYKMVESNPQTREEMKRQIVEQARIVEEEEQRKKQEVEELKARLKELGEMNG